MKKTKKMVAVEERFGKPLEEVITQLVNEKGIQQATKELGVSYTTFYLWSQKLGIQIKKTAVKV